MLRAIELRRFSKGARVSRPNGSVMMRVRYGVYFDETVDGSCGNTLLKHDPYRSTIRQWLVANVSGKYATQTSYVFFEEEEDAMLCYLSFKG